MFSGSVPLAVSLAVDSWPSNASRQRPASHSASHLVALESGAFFQFEHEQRGTVLPLEIWQRPRQGGRQRCRDEISGTIYCAKAQKCRAASVGWSKTQRWRLFRPPFIRQPNHNFHEIPGAHFPNTNLSSSQGPQALIVHAITHPVSITQASCRASTGVLS